MDLRQAIHEDAVRKGLVMEGELMTSFIVISAWQRVDENEGVTAYLHQIEQGMQTHEAVGLLTMGIEDVMNGDDDDG